MTFLQPVLSVALVASLAVVSAQSSTTIDCNDGCETARLLLIADSHILAPQQDLQDLGSNEVDVLTVLKSQARLWQVAAKKVADLQPPPRLALFAGDLVHDGFAPSRDLAALLHGPINGFHIARQLLGLLRLPLVLAQGNHDAKVVCGDTQASVPLDISQELFRRMFGADPYFAVRLGRWRLLVLNSLLGYTWNATDPRCNTKLSSYGERQLAWAARQLRLGHPTLVLLHYPLPESVMGEAPFLRWPDLVSLLSAHANVKLVLSGHLHKGADWGTLYPFPHITLPATRFDADNFLLLDLHANGTYATPDWPKNKGGSRCSQTWRYAADGGAEPAGAKSEPGDCGIPLAEDTAAYRLPPITSLDDIPKEFAPELTCSWQLAEQVLTPCLREGASSSCCSILADQTVPGSHNPFSACLCHPGFFEDTQAAFAAAGHDIMAVARTCVSSTQALILHRGSGACPPPAATGGAAGAMLGRRGGQAAAAAVVTSQ